MPLIVDIQQDLALLDSMNLLDSLLADKTTGKTVLWATDAYGGRGKQYEKDSRITRELLLSEGILLTRAQKETAQQDARTRQHAEVFTPLWIVRKMNDYADEEWFGYPDVFFKDGKPVPDKIRFWDNRKTWQDYADSRRLEITCGEAPFLVTRYDVETGEILPVPERTGILDRKLRVVSENAGSEAEWLTWAARAVEATYGYEFQGDNLLIARINVLVTVRDHLEARFGRVPTAEEYEHLLDIVISNLWQMDGLTDRIPYAEEDEPETGGLMFGMIQQKEDIDCRIHDWRMGLDVLFYKLKEDLYKVGEKSMKFDYIIGNPPYQDETKGENETFAAPIYHLFIEESYKTADIVELIHPARFLFNAGSTPKQWNREMLADPHLSILYYESNSNKVFSNTEIKGGIVITYHDKTRCFGSIGTFTPYEELNSVLRKVKNSSKTLSMSKIVVNSYSYHFTELLYHEHPDLKNSLSKGHEFDLKSNVMEKIPQVFFAEKPNDGKDYIQIYGRILNSRVLRYIRSQYINRVVNLRKYKVFLPAASGDGGLGEELTSPIVMGPNIGSTETFCSIGSFETEDEAQNALKYIKSKFARALLSILKVTQHITPEKFTYVPLQDFTTSSDIDWTKSIPEIDRQLYAKYGLDESEIEFIETHVKEMT